MIQLKSAREIDVMAEGGRILSATLCTSVNNEIVHGIPSDRKSVG